MNHVEQTGPGYSPALGLGPPNFAMDRPHCSYPLNATENASCFSLGGCVITVARM